MTENPEKKRRKWRIWRSLLIILVILIGIRLALPFIVLDQANKRLKKMPGYYGHVEDITISLFRGAYGVHDYYLDKQDTVTRERTPFIAGESLDLSVEWRALFKGRFVGEVILQRPMVRFTNEAVEPKEVAEDTVALKDLMDDFMPLRINRFEIHNGSFQFHDPHSTPQVHLAMENIELLAENLTTVENEEVLLPAFVTMDANVYDGSFYLDLDLDPLAESATFDMAAELLNSDMTLFNEFFKAYGNFDVERGRFGMYMEMAANEGKFVGYVKPIIKDIKVLGPQDKEKSIPKKLWQGLIGLGAMLLTNPSEKQIATKVPLEGDLNDPNVRSWYAIIDLLKNAFVRALEPQIDHEINIGQVQQGLEDEDRGFFNRLFGGKERDANATERRAKRKRDRQGK